MKGRTIKKGLMARPLVFIPSIIFVFFVNSMAQTPYFVWAQRAGGILGDYGQTITLDAAGNSYIVGSFTGSASFGAITLTSAGASDIFLVKYDADGNMLWAQRAGGTNSDYGWGITRDQWGNIIVTGGFCGSATFGSITLTSAGNYDIFIAKYDASGNVIWVKQAGGTDADYGRAIATDSGNIIVTGYFYGSATFGAITLTSAGSCDIFIAKYDVSGNLLWAKRAGGSTNDYSYAITSDPYGKYTITGGFRGSATFGTIILTSISVQDIFIAQYDISGNVLWAKQIGYPSPSTINYGDAITTDSGGNTIITGRGSPHEEGAVLIAKYDPSGNMLWKRQANAKGDDMGSGIDTDASNNVYVTGHFFGEINFQGITLKSAGSFDIFIVKYDASGNIKWATSAGGTDCEFAYDIATDSAGNCITTGSFVGSASFGTITLTSAGQSDIFVAKLMEKTSWITVTTPNGGEKWQVDTPQNILWNSVNISGNVNIQVSTDAGNSWLPINSNTTNTGSYIWTPTANYISDSCIIKISQVSNESVFDQSDSLFCIGMKSDVNFDGVVNELDIQLIIDIVLGTYTPSSSEFWAADGNNDGVVNVVDVQLAINWFFAHAKIIVISPNGGETWVVGVVQSIIWDPSIVSSKVKIEISTNLGNSWSTIVDSTQNSGSYSWIPTSDYVSDRCLIKITSRPPSSIFDQSDAPFTIASELKVTFPFPQSGWYLISLPVTPPNNSLVALFPTAIAAYAYNAGTGNYYSVTSLETRKGYWLLIPAATNVTISGTPLTTFTEHYATGWHLIGTVRGNTNFTNPNDNPNGAVIAAYGYNPATQQYYPAYPQGTGILNEKEGYWLAVLQTCDLTIGSSVMSEASVMATGNMELFKPQFGHQPPVPPFVVDTAVVQLLSNSHKIMARNYPNPFNPETMIEYSLPQAGLTQVYIYNALGQQIRMLLEAQQLPGLHQVVWDGRNDLGEMAANGIYFYKIITPGFITTQKMLLLR